LRLISVKLVDAVEEVPEYLVHFYTFAKYEYSHYMKSIYQCHLTVSAFRIASEFGLELIEDSKFHKFVYQNMEDEVRSIGPLMMVVFK